MGNIPDFKIERFRGSDEQLKAELTRFAHGGWTTVSVSHVHGLRNSITGAHYNPEIWEFLITMSREIESGL